MGTVHEMATDPTMLSAGRHRVEMAGTTSGGRRAPSAPGTKGKGPTAVSALVETVRRLAGSGRETGASEPGDLGLRRPQRAPGAEMVPVSGPGRLARVRLREGAGMRRQPWSSTSMKTSMHP